METAGVALAVVGTAELCLKYGSRLCEKYRSFRDAEMGFTERLLILENRWLKVEVQIEFLRNVWSDLPDRFQNHFHSILSVINSKLIAANDLLEQTIKKPGEQTKHAHAFLGPRAPLRRGAFALTLKDAIDNTILELDQWQRNMLDPNWYQLVLVPGLDVQKVASKSCTNGNGSDQTLEGLRCLLSSKEHIDDSTTDVFLPYDAVEVMASGIEFSKARLGTDKQSKDVVLLDRVQIPAGTDYDQSVSDIYHLVKFFSSIDPELFGFLPCRGALKDEEHCDLVFSFPNECDDPTSLRALLVQASNTYPLNARLNIAQMLARSVMFLHDCQFVHKSLRPDNIICFATQGECPDKPYMIGLDRFRLIDTRSKRLSDDLWYKDLYRHPTRQGIRPEKDYSMQHDIYSLGVCLLEIGLWQSFLSWEDDLESPTPREEYVLKKDLAIKDPRRRAFQVKKRLIKLAEERLPGSMGQIYTSTVVSCLTCLDAGNTGFGDQEDFEDDSGILIGVRYVEKVG
ncbi:MAG: hypothetical protein LQ352_005704 [Teloschistes flavicans]|nr:MAG: hypothetical protein LQ352_005704 [Teloschistes flavicans]